jgi:GNAT superfamily N-acetyltransferase
MNRNFQTPRGDILIRQSTAADAIRFRELRLSALLDSPIAFTADYQKNFTHPMKYWADLLSPQPDESTLFLAEHKNTLIGMTGIMRSNSPKTRHAAWVWGVYVTPGWRGLRVGEQMILSCLGWAKERNIVLAKLGVAAVNTPAIRCYERIGFKTYGTEPRVVLYEGSYYDEYLMSIDLDSG